MALRVFRLLLVLILVLQSLIAVADVHQLHQQKPIHRILIVDEPVSNIATFGNVGDADEGKVTPDGSSASVHQCSHCCHCHGTLPILATHAPCLPAPDKVLSVAEHSSATALWFSAPDFRPPIA